MNVKIVGLVDYVISVRLKNCKQVRENLNNYFMIYACLIEHNFDRNLDWFDFTERK